MMIHQCDICRKTVDRDEIVSVTIYGKYVQRDLCAECGESVVDLLRRHGLLEYDTRRSGFR
jgi:hypothetical protein